MIWGWWTRYRARRKAEREDPLKPWNHPKGLRFAPHHEVCFDYTSGELDALLKAADRQEYMKNSDVGWWVAKVFRNGFVFRDDIIPEDDVRAWMHENAHDLWTVGKFPNFLRPAVFVRHPDDALAFRMRFPAKYVHSTDLDVIATAIGMLNYLEGRKRPGLNTKP